MSLAVPVLLALTWSPALVAQAGAISGRVVDGETGQPVSAAQVFIPSLDLGAITQANGAYSLLNVPAGVHTLTVQRLGYRQASADVQVAAGETVVRDFQLTGAALALDEVIVTGTPGGTQRRALGNTVGRLDAGNLMEASAVRIEQAIGNSVTGVRMMNPAGAAGGETSIRIRGSSSLALAGDPLVYVDGVRLNTRRAFDGRGSATSRLQDIDPNLIESIEIIKGPAAATLYGTEASNGVIQIITKRGIAGEAVFDVSVEGGANWQPDPVTNFGLHWYRDSDGELRNHNLYLLEQEADRYGQPLFQYGPIQRYSASVRGGADLFRYFASVNRTDEEGFSGGDSSGGWSAQATLTAVPTEGLSLTVNAMRSTRDTHDMGSIMCSLACWATPNAVNTPGRGYGIPMEARLGGSTDIRSATRNNWSLEISHQPTSWLSHRFTAGLDDARLERTSFTPKGANGFWPQFFGTSGRDGVKSVWDVDTPSTTLDYSATVTIPLSEALQSRTSWGLQYTDRKETTVFATGRNFAVPALRTIGAAAERESSESFVENATVGTYFQNEFGWNDRRFLTLAVRFDDNSAFGSEFDAAVYPKVSGSWVLSEEDFFDWDFLGLSELRLRGAWGESGQQPDIFAAQRLYTPETGPNSQPVLTREAFGNPDLGPETGSEMELGLDAALLNDRVSVGFSWYNRVTKDAIVARPVRPSVGFPGTQFLNLGQTSNWGTETEISFRVIPDGPVRWNVDLGLTTMGNRVDEMGGIDAIPVVALSGMPSRGQFHIESYPIAGIFERKVVSAEWVQGNSGQVTNIMCDGGRGATGREMGGSPVPCEDAPELFWGGPDPTWTVHLGSSWNIGQWRLSATVDAQGGNVMIADYIAGQNTRFSEIFVKQNDLIFQANSQVGSRAADVIHDSGFARLRTVSLAYTFSNALAARFRANSASITASLFNVAVLWQEATHVPSGQRIWDPEMMSPNFEYSGIATGSPPPMSNATVRVNVSF